MGCRWVSLGLTHFADAEALQERLVAARARGDIDDLILLTSHYPVITIGRSGGSEDILAPLETLRTQGIAVHHTSRGGRATYHGPGQVIAYPILDLRALRPDVHWYLSALEEAVVATLAEVGVAASTREGLAGVWVDGRKIASIGIAVRRWVTSHGVALNVTGDLGPFADIVPCGLAGVRMTSIQEETGLEPEGAALEAALAGHIARALGLVAALEMPECRQHCAFRGTNLPAEVIVPADGGLSVG